VIKIKIIPNLPAVYVIKIQVANKRVYTIYLTMLSKQEEFQ